MAHVTEEKISTVVFDGAAWSTAEADHLAHCPACQERLSAFRALAAELSVARRSWVTPEAEARYFALFEQRPQSTRSLVSHMANWLRALQVYDSREAGVTAGVRSAGVEAGYRLLFEAEGAEIELLVEEENGARRVEGEYFGTDETVPGPVLIHLLALDGNEHVHEAESLKGGRFRFHQVAPGRYQLTLSTTSDEVVSIEALEIT